jgi:SecD/SecF fusion protein
MQNKGLIKLFAILFGLVSLYQLSFTFLANKVEDDAVTYGTTKVPDNDARQKAAFERKYLDSVANKTILDIGVAEYSYNDVKDKEMNLGLDLKGGINAILQVSVKEVLKSLTNDSKNEAFTNALIAADEKLKNSNVNYLDLFFEEFEKIAGTTKLSDPSIFGTKALSETLLLKKLYRKKLTVLLSLLSKF